MSESRKDILPGPGTVSVSSALGTQVVWTLMQFMHPSRDPLSFPLTLFLMMSGVVAGIADKKNSLGSGVTLTGMSVSTLIIANTISHAAFDTKSIFTRIDLPSPGFMGLDVVTALLAFGFFAGMGYLGGTIAKKLRP